MAVSSVIFMWDKFLSNKVWENPGKLSRLWMNSAVDTKIDLYEIFSCSGILLPVLVRIPPLNYV
jgi:hypothetical protein